MSKFLAVLAPLWLLCTLPGQAQVQDAILLRLAPPVGTVSRYHMRIDISVLAGDAAAAGMNISQHLYQTHRVTEALGDTRTFQITLDSMRLDPGSPMPMDLSRLDGMVQTVVMDERGRVRSMSVDSSTVPAEVRGMLGMVTSAMPGVSHEFPETPVSPGESWEATAEFGGVAGAASNATARYRYELDRIEGRGEDRRAIIAVTGTIDGDVATGMGGAAISGDVSGEFTVAVATGRMEELRMEMVMDTAAPGMGAASVTTDIHMGLMRDPGA